MKHHLTFNRFATLACCGLSSSLLCFAESDTPPQDPSERGPRDRGYTANEAKPLNLYPAVKAPPAESEVSITIQEESRTIRSNTLPQHKIGEFPNPGNPNTPSAQEFSITLPLSPKANEEATPARTTVGIFLNGVLMEAGTGEFWFGKNGGRPWNYAALGGAVKFGLDANHGHVQPTGKYHYHGQPTGFLAGFDISAETHSPLVGWAFDGFPIYSVYGYEDGKDPDSQIIANTSSYQLKKGERPTPPDGPGGSYDGAFTDDYEYVESSGTLDECNGRFTVTPDFPEGTYAYFLSNEWPVILHNYRGTPVGRKRGPGQGPPR